MSALFLLSTVGIDDELRCRVGLGRLVGGGCRLLVLIGLSGFLLGILLVLVSILWNFVFDINLFHKLISLPVHDENIRLGLVKDPHEDSECFRTDDCAQKDEKDVIGAVVNVPLGHQNVGIALHLIHDEPVSCDHEVDHKHDIRPNIADEKQ